MQARQAILDIVNAKRAEVGVPALTLGANVVAQIHAQSALDNCFLGHWGKDGLHVYMQYSLAGGYQAIEVGLSGLSYCRREQPAEDSAGGLRDVLDEWLSTPGSLVNPRNHRISIGIAYDDYNLSTYAILEGDYVEYTDLPKIEDDSLIIEGSTKHDVRFDAVDQLGITVLYDPPPEPLTIGQLARGACYHGSLPIAFLVPPGNVGIYQSESPVEDDYVKCTIPRDISPDMPAPQSIYEARSVYSDSWYSAEVSTNTIPQIRSSNWVASGNQFAVNADIGDLLEEHGAGVYTVVVFGRGYIISHYSIFHGITPPDTYGAGLQPAQ